MSSADILFEVRNSFYLANMQHCINEAHKVKATSEEQRLEKDILMYRAYIAQKKYGVVIDEIHGAMSSQLQAIKTLALYFSGDSVRRSKITKELETNISETDAHDYVECLVAAIIYYYEDNYESALRALHKCDNLECSAMLLQIYLKLDRIDLARKELKRMQEKDDDSTLTQLANAWINLAVGGERLQDAYYIFQELSDKYGSTPLTLNGQAVALIGQTKYEESEPLLQESLDKDSNNEQTLINLIVISQFVGKPIEVTNRYISQLKDSNNNSPFMRDYSAKEREFDSLTQHYQI